jgi:hypothetical protein
MCLLAGVWVVWGDPASEIRACARLHGRQRDNPPYEPSGDGILILREPLSKPELVDLIRLASVPGDEPSAVSLAALGPCPSAARPGTGSLFPCRRPVSGLVGALYPTPCRKINERLD